MMRTGSVLAIDDSEFLLEILRGMLQPHFSTVRTATTYRDAIQILGRSLDTDVVICDAILADGTGLQLLEHLTRPEPPHPVVILAATQWTDATRQKALAHGAVGCLQKPISFQELRGCLVNPVTHRPRAPRHATLARAWVIDPVRRERLLSLDIHDISVTGALLSTAGPISVGTELTLEIVDGPDAAVRAKGTVVRSQEPSWLDAGGAAVQFGWVESPQRLAQLLGEQ